MAIMSAATTEAFRASWLSPFVETYIAWLREQRVRDSVVRRRVPLLLKFGTFAQTRAATRIHQLPPLIDPFVEDRVRRRARPCSPDRLRAYGGEVRLPIEQMLRIALPEVRHDPTSDEPGFFGRAVGFFESLREERGLREGTLQLYRYHLVRFEQFLEEEGLSDLDALLPVHLDSFMVSARAWLCAASMPALCSALRLLFRWLYRERRISRDLSGCVEAPQVYRLSSIPRSISWEEVERTLAAVDRTAAVGRRDYAMLTLIVLYGLRAREVAALTLDDLDWKGERVRVGGRKAGHSTTYPLSPVAGEALIAYLRDGRPATTERHIFLQAVPPRGPVTHHVVAARAGGYLRKAGIVVRRPGSHTLRHSCAQRLVDADFSLKEIGDYLGHRAPSSTEIYTKVAVEALRHVALGDGEVVL